LFGPQGGTRWNQTRQAVSLDTGVHRLELEIRDRQSMPALRGLMAFYELAGRHIEQRQASWT
jgi:hypothetical protein